MKIKRTYTYRLYEPFPNIHGFPGFSGNGLTCANSGYQATLFFPRGLGTRLIPDLTCILRFSGRRGLRKIDGWVGSGREASPTARIERTLIDCQLAATTRERGLLSQLPPLMLTCLKFICPCMWHMLSSNKSSHFYM